MAMTALTLAATGYSAYAQHQAGKQQQKIANRNADLLDRAADDALARGEEEAKAARRSTKLLVGQQRVAAASQGLDVNTGTAATLQDQAMAHGAADELQIRKNAWREAWGIKTQGRNQRMEGAYARRAGTNNAIGTTLGGSGTAYSYWQRDRAPYIDGSGRAPSNYQIGAAPSRASIITGGR